MTGIKEKIILWFNNQSIRKKQRALYIFCVLVPLIVTDSVILYSLVGRERTEQQYKMEGQASAVQYNLLGMLENSFVLSKNFYMNDYVHSFLDEEYKTPMDYIVSYQDFIEKTLFESSIGVDNTSITIYADNETIVNGGVFSQLSTIEEEPWMKEFRNSEENIRLMFYYDEWNQQGTSSQRKVLFLRKLYNPSNDKYEKILKIEIEYSGMVNNIINMNYEFPVYVCKGNKLIFSNVGPNNISQDFEKTSFSSYGYKKKISIYGEDIEIVIMQNQTNIVGVLIENITLLIPLLLINIILPFIMMQFMEKSITVRIQKLIHTFETVEDDALLQITDIDGEDEIGNLMLHYNRMSERINELIQTVYKDKLKEQEINIARQNAELLALHSQINPHFLFNVLESIRMHSILRKEYETARMVEMLAIIERRNVDWSADTTTTKREIEFVKAYLELQKYRFGDRLQFELDIEPECENILIPRLTIVTFVENACVHGIEGKTTPGWIFVRVFREKNNFCIEVEDTGTGMEEYDVKRILERIQNVNIEMVKEKKHVGILNACLRIKMKTDDAAEFYMESEKGIGTTMYIQIPMEKLESR